MGQGIKIMPVKNASATATIVASLTVIGLVGAGVTTDLDAVTKALLAKQDNLLLFNNADEALELFRDKEGTIREDLYDISMQNVHNPIVISFVGTTSSTLEKDPALFYESTTIKTKVIEAVENLKTARTIWGRDHKVRIAIAPWFAHDDAVGEALDMLAVSTKTMSVRDLKISTEPQALTKLQSLGSRRQLTVPAYRKHFSIFENKEIEKPCAAIIAGHISAGDAKLGEFGWAYDHANRAIYGVGSMTMLLSYEEGDDGCGINVLAEAGGTLLLNDDGWKLYNFETPSDDARFNKLETVRYFDFMSENIQQTLKKHKHRPATDVFNLAKADVDVFAGKAVLAGVSVGNRVTWSERNTPSEVAAGVVYLKYVDSNNVGIRTIVVDVFATNEFYTLENLTEGN
jgi:hypothetical protein